MPGDGPKEYPCVSCGHRTKPNRRRFITGPTYEPYRQYLGLNNCKDTDVTCTTCYSRYHRLTKQKHVEITEDEEETVEDPDYVPPTKKAKASTVKSPQIIPLPILSTGKSHSSCCICKKRGNKFVSLPAECRHTIFIVTGCLILSGARSCSEHLTKENSLKEDAIRILKNLDNGQTTYFNKTELQALISNIRTVALKNEKNRIDFDNDRGLDEEDYINLTGITKNDFEDLVSHAKSIRASKNRSIKTCIALLLVKLRTGLSNRMLSTLFNVEKTGVRRAISTARKELTQNFTPKYVGFEHISRQDIINDHTRPLAQELLGDLVNRPAILVVDGTYIFIQKSNNFKFQRRSYSLHKNRPLVKPMMIVSTTGYIVSVLGPYHADSKNNDANILKHNFQTNMEHIKDWLQEEDILIVDRGFRDSISFLEDLGIKAQMPFFLPKGQKQHSVEEVKINDILCRKFMERCAYDHRSLRYIKNVNHFQGKGLLFPCFILMFTDSLQQSTTYYKIYEYTLIEYVTSHFIGCKIMLFRYNMRRVM